MALSKEDLMRYNRRLLLSRARILCNNGFYGLLLMHMKFVMNEASPTAYTDGFEIGFNPSFLDSLKDSEVDFVMMHEILHVALRHCERQDEKRDALIWNIAADIVVNSNIMRSSGMKKESISIDGKPLMHEAPNGKHGYEYTVEEVYDMLLSSAKKQKRAGGQGSGSGNNAQGQGGSSGSSARGGGQGSSSGSNQSGQGGNQQGGRQAACGGSRYTKTAGGGVGSGAGQGSGANARGGGGRLYDGENGILDDHSKWGTEGTEKRREERIKWEKYVLDAAEVVRISDPSNQCGSLPLGAERMIEEMRKPTLDWKTILNSFVQEEIVDYSFFPPDRRFDGSDFFLPDFNLPEEYIGNILFMVDTSASISDTMINEAYSEIVGAIEQYDGRLKGKLGFFDACVYPAVEFESVKEVLKIRPRGGGGTNFHIIFDYVMREMAEEPPRCIIILTDGYAPFPDESARGDIPVLWLINGSDVKPPWGKIAYMGKSKKK